MCYVRTTACTVDTTTAHSYTPGILKLISVKTTAALSNTPGTLKLISVIPWVPMSVKTTTVQSNILGTLKPISVKSTTSKTYISQDHYSPQ